LIRSMTGFGRAEYGENGTGITAEISSTNGRFFDLKAKIPKCLIEYERELNEIAKKFIARGRAVVSISLTVSDIRAKEMTVDSEIANRYIQLAEELSARYNIENNLDTRTLLSLPETISWKETCSDNQLLWELAKKAFIQALEEHTAMREKEGSTIEKDVRIRIAVINSCIEEIKKQASGVAESNAVRLRGKIENLIGRESFDETRFAMEIALYSDRVDITEECVRFISHNEQFTEELSAKKTSGRKLLFILQEMNREINTIGSKIQDASISRKVVQIKEELEKIREQAENME